MLKTSLSRLMEYLFKDGLYISFYRLVDYAVKNNTGTQFPRSLYVDIYRKDILNHKDPMLADILTLDQMIKAGVILEPTKNSQLVSLHQDFFNFLIYLDSTKAKEFSNKEFEELRQSMRLVVDNLKSYADEEDSDNFTESWVHFNNVVNNIISSLDRNLGKLSSSVDEIASIYNKIHKRETDITIADLYDKAVTLQDRYILPCYNFLDAERQLIKMFVELRTFYEQRGDIAKATSVIQFEAPIASYRRKLNVIRDKLNSNLSNIRSERETLLAGEKLFNDLMESMNDVRTGRTRFYKLTNACPAFEDVNYFEGLYNHNSTNNELLSSFDSEEMEWYEFKDWLNYVTNKPLPESTTNVKKKEKTKKSQGNKVDKRQMMFMSKIAKAINKEPRVYIPDVYEFVYNEGLKINNITSIDYFLDGLEHFLGSLESGKKYIRSTGVRKSLSDNVKRLDYTVVKYQKTN